MKKAKIVTIVIAFVLLFAMVTPASAQLGDTDISSFTIQNISDSTATVSVQFISVTGVSYVPAQLDGLTPTQFPNPFTLAPGASRQVYVPGIPAAQLPSGQYSVAIASSQQIAAVASVAGTGTRRFTGDYSGFSTGSTTVTLASTAFNFSGWYSMISVQNLGASPADVTLTITCSSGTVGTLQRLDIPSMAEHTFVLKTTTPTGFTPSTVCNGSTRITSDQPVVATDSMSKPSTGATNTFEGVSAGSTKLYAPSLTTAFSGWNSSLTIRKLESGNTTVTVDYSDAESNDTCNLTDSQPACQLYMPSDHPTPGLFGAKITSSTTNPLLAVVGLTKGSASGAYLAAGSGTSTVMIPEVTKYYYNWISSITCQNVSTTPTTLNFAYTGYPAYNHPTTLNEGGSVQVFVPSEAFLPNGFVGGVTVRANAAGAQISCIVSENNPTQQLTKPGDWAFYYNAYNK